MKYPTMYSWNNLIPFQRIPNFTLAHARVPGRLSSVYLLAELLHTGRGELLTLPRALTICTVLKNLLLLHKKTRLTFVLRVFVNLIVRI